MKETDRARLDRGGTVQRLLRDRLQDASGYTQYRRAICERAGNHLFAHGHFEPAINTYVARCLICDYVQAMQKVAGVSRAPTVASE